VTVTAPIQRRRRIGSMEVLLASLIALALTAGAMSAFVAGHADVSVAATVFCGVFVQALPFLVLGVVISGLIAAFVSADRLARWLPRRPAVAVAVAGVGGAALLYRSRNLRDWEYLHPLCTGNKQATGTVWECPDFFALGAKHVLVISPIPLRKSIYLVGTYAEQRFTPERIGEVDVGGHFYAPQTLRDERGRRIMFGWLWEGRSHAAQEAAGWAGVMSLPRVLTLRPDGGIGFEPAPELVSLRGAHRHWEAVAVASSEWILPEVQSDAFEIIAEIAPGDLAVCGVDVLRSPDGAEYTRIAYDGVRRRLEIDRRRSSSNPEDQHDVQGGDLELIDGEPLRLHIFVDRSVVEVFANGRVCTTSRVYPSRIDSLEVALFAEGGAAEARTIDIWRMASIWTP